jgi:hypothetical protein
MVAMGSTYVARQYIDLGEAALTLGCTIQEVRRYIDLGLLDRYRLRGTYIRVRRDQVNELASVDPNLLRIA